MSMPERSRVKSRSSISFDEWTSPGKMSFTSPDSTYPRSFPVLMMLWTWSCLSSIACDKSSPFSLRHCFADVTLPVRGMDLSTQSVAVRPLDRSPAGHIGLAFELQGFRQQCAFPDKNSSCFGYVWHCGSPRCRHRQLRKRIID